MPRADYLGDGPVKIVRNGSAKTLLFTLFFFSFISCSLKSGSPLLRFFFDGVPVVKETDSSALTLQTTVVSDSTRKPKISNLAPSIPGLNIHPPYRERTCEKCHLPGEPPGTTSYGQDRFCYGCHKNFSEIFTVVHGPVAGGFCTNCHSPHQSMNAKLLLRKGQAICTSCHTLSTVLKNEAHADIGNTSCTECHNPHGGDDRYLSR